jgi:UDP-glucose 4-epimerase
VLDVISVDEKASGSAIPYEIVGRHPLDIANCYANPAFEQEKLDRKVEYELDEMCEDV